MDKMSTAEEFFEQHIQKGVNNTHSNYLKTAKKFAKLHVEAALKEASGNATATIKGNCSFICDYFINKESILNAYPLSNIK